MDSDSCINSNEEPDGNSSSSSGAITADVGGGSSDAIRLLDEELVELEKLIKLQARKVEALEELRRQWLSGERKLPNHVPPLGSLERVLVDDGRGVPAPTSDTRQNTGLGHKWGTSTPPSQLPTGYYEEYMTPHAKFPSSSAVVATEMFSFRLKGGSSSKSRPSSSSSAAAAGGVRSGFLNVFAYLHADGMVRLRDTDAEEILVFDAGHSRREASPSLTTADSSSSAADDSGSLNEAAVSSAAAVETATPAAVVGMTADSSESGPVLVTAGTDGTARVHALAVYYRGKQVAGVGVRGGRSDQSGRRKKAKASDPSGSSSPGEAPRRGKGSSEKKGDHGGGGGDRSHGSPAPPPTTAMGVGVTVEFKTCLGSACRSPDGLSQLRSMGGDGETVSVGNGGGGGGGGGGDQETAGSMSGSLPPQGEETATVITSMDAFFHRSLGTTVVIAGYSSGGVSFYHAGNGTELASVDTGSSAVLAVKRGGQARCLGGGIMSIAFTDGEDVHFASSTKFTRVPGRVCRGRRSGGGGGGGGEPAVVTALAFDAVSTGVLYVGFLTGDVMAYDSRVQEMDSSYACLPSHRLPPPLPQQRPSQHADPSTATAAGDGGSGGSLFGGGGGGGGCDSISTVRGYAIVSHGCLLSVYNTTDHAGRLLFTTHSAAAAALAEGASTEDQCGAPLSPGTESRRGGVRAAALAAAAEEATPSGGRTWSVMSSSGSGEVLVVEASRCSAEVVVHRAVLPYERNGPDMSWVRFPVLLLGLFVVAITQVYSRRAANNAVGRTSRKKGRSGSRGWRGAGLSDEDDEAAGGGGFSADALAQLRDDLRERTSRRRDWRDRRLGYGQGGGGGGARERLLSSSSSSRLPAPRQGYGDPWADEGYD
ncbi:unnamed protein product [Ectocarpus sp. 12 AP-2014]